MIHAWTTWEGSSNLATIQKNGNLELNYLYSNSTVGIPGHTHDINPAPESFMLDEQNRGLFLTLSKDSKPFWKHQGQLLYQFQKQNGILCKPRLQQSD